jgi:hypothetical protein
MSTNPTPRLRRRRWLWYPDGLVALLIVSLATALSIRGCFTTTRITTRTSQATSDIRQVESAIGLFKAKFNVGYLAAVGGGPNGEFRLCSSYADANGDWLDWPEVKYLKHVFPLMDRLDNGLRWNGQSVTPDSPRLLDVNQSLVFFLTGGPFTKYQGFSLNKQRPFMPMEKPPETRIGPFLDLPSSKYSDDGRVLDPWGTPLAYFTSVQGNDYTGSFTWNGSTVRPYREPGSPDRFVNPKRFQIICAGRNGVFGPGGNWTPGEGEWSADGPGGDDLSNFNNGTLDGKRP